MFLGLHGADGEDGKIQAALDLLGVPYTGSDPLGSAMAMDKAVAKRIMESAGVRTPAWRELRYTEADIPALAESLPVPCAVKVVNGGSSIGVALPDTREELEQALYELLRFHSRVVVEEKIIGREITVPVFNGRALSPIEIVPPEGGSFDYVAKYQSGAEGARELCPAPITEEETQSCWRGGAAAAQGAGPLGLFPVGLHHGRRRSGLVSGDQHPARHDAQQPDPQGRRGVAPSCGAALGRSCICWRWRCWA